MNVENLNNGNGKKFLNPSLKDIKQPSVEPPRITENHINKRKMQRSYPKLVKKTSK